MIIVIWHNMTIIIACQQEISMPWSKDHKRATRGRILETASTALRAKGVAGVGVAQVMEAAGLTHGGFYAHFGSKDELVANALAHALEQSGKRIAPVIERAPADEKLRAVADAYLTADHLADTETGCPIVALGSELVRGKGPAREAYAEHVRKRVEELEAIAPGKTKLERRRAAAGTYAAMIGGLLLARALGDAEGEKFLAQVRGFLKGSLDLSK
jgi:TetR/AcrR family transcriptional repressor of nem operon